MPRNARDVVGRVPVERLYHDAVAASTSYIRNRESSLIARYIITGNEGRGYAIIWIEGHAQPYALTKSELDNWEEYATDDK
jgi:hypothetical protein